MKSSDILSIIDALDAGDVTIKLGHIPDEQRAQAARCLSGPLLETLKARKRDVLRVLLAKEMVEEAQGIERTWNAYPGQRSREKGLAYRDLMVSARAMLPTDVTWEDVAYSDVDGTVPWYRQLTFDGAGYEIEGVEYAVDEMAEVIEYFKAGGS